METMSSKAINAKNVYRVAMWAARNPIVEQEKRVIVYFPATESLYMSVGSEVFYRDTGDSAVTYAFTLKTADGFGRTFRVMKDGSGNYFEGGGYVSVIVSSKMPLSAIENLVSDILGSADEIRKVNELKRQEQLLAEKLQAIRDELSSIGQ